MKTLYRLGGALALLMMLTASAQAETTHIPPRVDAKLDSMRVAMYGQASEMRAVFQYSGFRQRGDATRSAPAEVLENIKLHVDNLASDEDAVLVGSSSPMRVDAAYTQGSTTLNVTWNEAIQLGRARYLNDQTGRRCVVSSQGIADDVPGAYLMIIHRAPGSPSLVPGREAPRKYVSRDEFLDSLAQHRNKLGNHEKRIKALEERPTGGGLLPGDIGLSAFIGYSSYQIDGHTFNGGTVGMTYRYMDFALEGFAGELFSNSRQMESIGEELIPRYTNNHFEGGSIYWAPMQTGYEWGRYWKLGATGMHAQRDNIENFSNLDVYYAGAAGILSCPLLRGLTLEAQGSIGYGWSTMASETFETAPTKSQGLGYGLRGALVLGRR